MSGYNKITAESFGALIELLVLHIAVTVDARIGSAACFIGFDEALDDLFSKVIGEVKNVIRHAKTCRDLTGILGILKCTAGMRAADACVFIVI